MKDVLQEICKENSLSCQRFEQVFGGDINQAFCLTTDTGKYFIKLNNAAAYPNMFCCEADGLKTLQHKSPIRIPSVINHGIAKGTQWLLLEWIEKGQADKDFWKHFGRALAALHKNSNEYFGFHTDNYIGSLSQPNQQNSSWPEFYCEQRLYPLSKILFDNGSFSRKEIEKVATCSNVLSSIFPSEPPALLHGDLWAGNFMINAAGQPCIYDPAVYYGHREMDIAMTLLFGGFDGEMYTGYDEAYPLEPGWRQRVKICRLYPLLVHAVLFGGHYVPECKNILSSL